CMERLLLRGTYPGIATHDARIIEHAKTFARDKGIAPARFEFQMLYGVRRDLQLALRRQGYNVRVYVPFGTQWYPYLMRRLADRPVGHLETEYLGSGATPAAALAPLLALTLHELKHHLDRCIERQGRA